MTRARDLLAALWDGCDGVIELRALRGAVRVRYFAPDDLDGMVAFAREHVGTANLYWGIATRRDTTGGTARNCRHLAALFADIDFKDIGETEARQRLAACPCPPSLVIASGGGLHAYWFLREPADATDTVKPWLRRLAAYLGADLKCAEVARVLRIPGTLNHKYSPPRRVAVERFEPERRYNLVDLDEWLPAESRLVSGGAPFALPGAIGPGGRNDALFRLGRSLKVKGVHDGAIRAALVATNADHCVPQLPTAEVEQIVRSVLRQPDGAGGQPRHQRGDETALTHVSTPLTLTPLGDLLAEPEEDTEWVVEDRVPSGSVVMIVGKPKSGKSTAARDLAFAVATGGRWLNHPCIQGTVWYLALEEKRGEVRRHFRKMGATGDEPIHLFINQAPTDLVAQLAALAAQDPPRVIIIDTLQRFLRVRDLNDYAEVVLRFDPILKIARQTGAALVLLHHAGKGAGRDVIDTVLGSTALVGSVDNTLFFSRTDRYRSLTSIQRVGPDLPETLVVLDETTGRVSLGGTRQEADIDHIVEQMVDALTNASDPMLRSELDAVAEGRVGNKRRAIKLLVGRGHATVSGMGKAGSPHRYELCSRVPSKSGNTTSLPPDPAQIPRDSAPMSCSRVPVRGSVPEDELNLDWGSLDE